MAVGTDELIELELLFHSHGLDALELHRLGRDLLKGGNFLDFFIDLVGPDPLAAIFVGRVLVLLFDSIELEGI